MTSIGLRRVPASERYGVRRGHGPGPVQLRVAPLRRVLTAPSRTRRRWGPASRWESGPRGGRTRFVEDCRDASLELFADVVFEYVRFVVDFAQCSRDVRRDTSRGGDGDEASPAPPSRLPASTDALVLLAFTSPRSSSFPSMLVTVGGVTSSISAMADGAIGGSPSRSRR